MKPNTSLPLAKRCRGECLFAMWVFKHKARFNFKAGEKHSDKAVEGYIVGLEVRITALEATQLALQTKNNKLNAQVCFLKKGYLDLLEKSIQVQTVQRPTLPVALSADIKCSGNVLKPTKASERNHRLASFQARIALRRRRQL
jgi:hypothetical protein